MFGIGSTEILVILVVALIVLGPESLPKIARTIGKALGEFRKVSTEFQRTLNTEIALEEHEKKKKEAEKELFPEDKEETGENPVGEEKVKEEKLDTKVEEKVEDKVETKEASKGSTV